MKKIKPATKKLTLGAESLRALTADRLEQAIGGGTASCTCSNNSCENQHTGCKPN